MIETVAPGLSAPPHLRYADTRQIPNRALLLERFRTGEAMARSKSKQKRVRQLRNKKHKRQLKRRKAEKLQQPQS